MKELAWWEHHLVTGCRWTSVCLKYCHHGVCASLIACCHRSSRWCLVVGLSAGCLLYTGNQATRLISLTLMPIRTVGSEKQEKVCGGVCVCTGTDCWLRWQTCRLLPYKQTIILSATSTISPQTESNINRIWQIQQYTKINRNNPKQTNWMLSCRLIGQSF